MVLVGLGHSANGVVGKIERVANGGVAMEAVVCYEMLMFDLKHTAGIVYQARFFGICSASGWWFDGDGLGISLRSWPGQYFLSY